jgi:hypothetical protein
MANRCLWKRAFSDETEGRNAHARGRLLILYTHITEKEELETPANHDLARKYTEKKRQRTTNSMQKCIAHRIPLVLSI